MESTINTAKAVRWSTGTGAMVGIGLMAGVDEIVFHQILAWHHFYDGASETIGIMADGFLHAFELVLLVAGFFLLLDLRRRNMLLTKLAWAGTLVGAGGFQLFDGIVNHKLLRLHQVRYVDNVLPYDVAWNAVGLLLLGVGLIMYRRRVSNHD
ncbi:MAG TPA: DUF2243 domain-containing protein [Sphingobacterium sp.]|jgi:uncharacterized membrane protein|nr:DUF2243 domain-containing protein [Sphingobacterium sp.]